MKRLIIILTMMTGAICCNARSVDNSTDPSLDLGRYLGKWYEIARYDHSFEKGVHFTTADYTIQQNGRIKVVNSGMKEGKKHASTGKAKLTDTNGLLRVSFFGPFYSDYRVLMVDDDYEYALVGSKSSKYLWILSRSPKLPGGILHDILVEATRRGYDTSKLTWVNQDLNTIVPKNDYYDYQ